MTFKQNWEKAESPVLLSDDAIKGMVSCAGLKKSLSSFEILSGGCANLNIKLCFEEAYPLLLRIYLRDSKAADREQKIACLLQGKVPIPVTHYKGKYQNYTFAIINFISGITLRDLLLSSHSFDLEKLLFEVGMILAQISHYKFPEAGFLNGHLEVILETSNSFLLSFAEKCLKNQNLAVYLKPEILSQLQMFFDTYKNFLPKHNEANLVHGDFDPANILVDQKEGHWYVTGVLDWEFAFSGSILWDMANMLRYAHHMPPLFTQAFVQGIKKGGISLPAHWQEAVYLLNLISLLEMLTRSELKNRPQQQMDIVYLIDYFLQQFRNKDE